MLQFFDLIQFCYILLTFTFIRLSTKFLLHNIGQFCILLFWSFRSMAMEQHILDTNAGKQLSSAAKYIYLTLVLKKWTAFKYRLEL
jgi:hypothetical protein